MAQPLEPRRAASAPLDGVVRTGPALYCGGAMVDPEEVPLPPRPTAGLRITVVTGEYFHDGAPAAELTTAGDGSITASLPAGRYCLVLAPRGPKPPDGTCERMEWETCTAVVDVPVAETVAVDHRPPCWSSCSRPRSAPP